MIDSKEKNKVDEGTLYLVATPIGNLSDISERALKVLSEVDFIAAEDTRNSVSLLTHFGIKKPLVSYHEHNKREKGVEICDRLRTGESCALITDAGTPAISDPGEDLVRLCAENGIPVTSLPGCCAAITALTLSALPTGRFTFEGFLSAMKKERRERLDELSGEVRTMIFHEAPHKLKATLADMENVFGSDRKISLCRELTKLNEDVMRTTLGDAVRYYNENDPRGEYVLVVEGGIRKNEDLFWQDMSVTEHVEYYIDMGIDRMEAIKRTAKDRGVNKNSVYMEYVTKENV
ncbi:MAG: 16S rRNA (cytidine(1402)-2'-O)-methyltransferase [Clostridia bacterium]|nr:16S rRNA (cytidine(1402)-2'-O)-methyltransferase [Clostridia bacterium]